MSELPKELEMLASGVHGDEARGTVYVRARGLAPSDLPGYIHRFRQVLAGAPDNVGARFLLAVYLQMSGQDQEARIEFEQVAQSGDGVWSVKARQMLDTQPESPTA